MTIYTVMIIVCVVLVLALIVFSVLAFWDWRGWMIRKVGADYRRGLAHIKANGVWTYRESKLIYEGSDAMSYIREVDIEGKKEIVTDVVPNGVGFSVDEYTGSRVYRVQPGGTVGYPDDGNAPAVDYPARLISTHVLGRTAVQFASSVTADNSFNWKPILIIGVFVVIAAVVAFFLFKPGIATPATSTPKQTETNTPAQTEQLTDEPPAGYEIQGGE